MIDPAGSSGDSVNPPREKNMSVKEQKIVVAEKGDYFFTSAKEKITSAVGGYVGDSEPEWRYIELKDAFGQTATFVQKSAGYPFSRPIGHAFNEEELKGTFALGINAPKDEANGVVKIGTTWVPASLTYA